jgi:hypothetical protein
LHLLIECVCQSQGFTSSAERGAGTGRKTMILSELYRVSGASLDAIGTEQTATKIKPQFLSVVR